MARETVLQQNYSALANALAIDGFDLAGEDVLRSVPPPPAQPSPETLTLISNFRGTVHART